MRATDTVAELRQATEKLTQHVRDLRKDYDLPLKFEAAGNGGHKVKSGILWIPGPFKTDFWSGRRKKPKPTKCTCPTCGVKHNLKR